MGLTTLQLGRLSELLDLSLSLSVEARRAWLDSLNDEDRELVRPLRATLLSSEPDPADANPFDGLPSIRAASTHDSSTTVRRAGERLGTYELLKPLGAGGMAEVWLARRADGVFERQVALKIPRLSHVPEEMAERFARECRILATLECPGIARLYDAGVDGGVPFIAMEYVQGEPLIAWCDSHGLDVRARIDLFLQILGAVGRAHAHGIVHRDLKPSNILVTEEGDVRLLDFGVSSLLNAGANSQSLTSIYGRALTPEYASPELLRGDPIDARSDIYSLGAVLHELLTGARPGQPRTEDGQDRGEMSAGLRTVVAKALATSPDDRYPDSAALATALRSFGVANGTPRRGAMVRNFVMGAAIVLAAAIGAAVILKARFASSPHPPTVTETRLTDAPTTIAVLPFVDLSEPHDKSYLSDGLAVDLIDLLTKIPELRVTARASSFAFRHKQVDLASIARQLNVDHVLEGSVRTSGDRLKFTVQLVRAGDGTAIWSETYDREMEDIFEIQESVSEAVVDALKLQLLKGNTRASALRTTNVRAYEEYLIGRQYRDGASRERNLHAKAAFERAVALDPTFAPAHAGIALAAADIGLATMANESYEIALLEAERALTLAPHLAEAYVARAQVRLGRDWDFTGAKSDLDFALNIDPNNIELLQAYASFLWMTGKTAAALEIQLRCVARNPLASKTWDWLGLIQMDARNYAAARESFERSAELSPYSDYRWLLSTLVELYSGNYEEALRLARANPDINFRDYSVSMAASSTGRAEESRDALQRLITRAPEIYAAQIAFSYAWQGNEEQTFVWLDRAIAQHDQGLLGFQYRPEFDKFKDDPRYQSALRRIGVSD